MNQKTPRLPLRAPARSVFLLGLLALLPGALVAATYYVSPTGSDSNAGTLSAPFKSITKAQSVAASGDTVYLRGGTYSSFTIASSDSTYHYVHTINKSGISYVNYPGETPVFNFSSIPTDLRVAGFYVTASNIHFTGVQVTATPVGSQKQSECFRIYGSTASCTFTTCVCHDNAANGFYFTNHATGSCTNCDSYNNIGSSSASIGNTDGFGAHGNGVTFQYCRSWHNSDDGYDCIASYGANTYDHCWAYNMTAGGDSNAFKVGGWGTSTPPSSVPVHTVQYCLAASCNAHGFYANHQPGQAANWTHNTSFNNAGGDFDMLERVSTTDATDIPGYREVLHYNIAYKSTLVKDDADPAAQETSNSWTESVTVNDADFQSTDPTQITRARNSDGSLPSITFMHLASGSDLAGLGCF